MEPTDVDRLVTAARAGRRVRVPWPAARPPASRFGAGKKGADVIRLPRFLVIVDNLGSGGRARTTRHER
jgi:hypothetical protein